MKRRSHLMKDRRDANVERLLENTVKDWRVYNATSRYEIKPDLVEWFYPPKNYLKNVDNAVRFEGDDDNNYYGYEGGGGDGEKQDDGSVTFDEDGTPRYVIDDRAIRIHNVKVLDKLVPNIVPKDSYFEPGELDIIESVDNPFRAPCRHHFGLFIRLA